MTSGKQFLMSMALAVFVMGTQVACRKEPGVKQGVVQPLPTPVGTPTGPKVTGQIGAAGGHLTSADGQLTITIPAGAVTGNTEFGIEPVTNTNVAGIGTSYALTPHAVQFNKSVSITYSWAGHADSVGLLPTLGLAYQAEDGVWKYVGATHIDEAAKTVTYETSHFSKWSLMNQVSLAPFRAELEPGAKKTIEAYLYTQLKETDEFGTIPEPNSPGYPVGAAIPLPLKYIKQWRLAGPGKITAKASSCDYEAPASVSEYVTAALSVELKSPAAYPGQYLLVSNITVLGSFVELSVGGSTPVTFPATPVVKNGNYYALANPSNEGGGYFVLSWTGGMGEHPFDLANRGTYTHFLTPQASYISRYRPDISSPLSASGGQVNITRLSGGWAEGTFNATDAGISPDLVSTTTLTGKFKVKLAQ